MKPLTRVDLRGNWATLLLPIRSDDSIDYDILGAELDVFATALVSGAYSNGTAGEFFSQSEAEFDRINRMLAESCERSGIPFQVGVSQMSPQLSLERLRRSRALEPSGFQLILPDWYPPTMDDVHRFLDVMESTADPIPLVVYNPPHAKRRLVPAEWAEIVERHPGVVGIKVADGDADWYEAMRPVSDKISVFVPGHHLATGLSRGARGAYSNVACLSPRRVRRGGTSSACGIPAEGLKLEARIVSFINEQVMPLITMRKLPNMGADKVMAVAGGWLPGMSTRIRWPYEGAPMDEAKRIGAEARSSLPELFHE